MLFEFNEFVDAPDKFRYILEREDSCSKAEQVRLRGWASSTDDPSIELALVHLGRLYSEPSFPAAMASLATLRSESPLHPTQNAKWSLVHAATLLYKGRKYAKAAESLSRLHHKLQTTEEHFMYGMTERHRGVALMYVGDHAGAEEAFQNALATFRRFAGGTLYWRTLNDYAVLKKKLGQYEEAEKCLNTVATQFRAHGLLFGLMSSHINLGFVQMRTGSLEAAKVLFTEAQAIESRLQNEPHNAGELEHPHCHTNLGHVLLLQRRFNEAKVSLSSKIEAVTKAPRVLALTHEFLGELYTETGDYIEAQSHLGSAHNIASEILPESDVMTEVLRRRAELELRRRDYQASRETSIQCMRLCKKIGDKYELGAALRILGQVYHATGQIRRAASCFETSIRILKGIRESYELMRSCIAYARLLVAQDGHDADIHLMEARQLCRKLELDFYLAQVLVLQSRRASGNDNYEQARALLVETEEICNRLQDCDQKQIREMLLAASDELDKKIVHVSMKSAESLKTMCRVYEEARFPLREIKSDLAYQVAQSVEADSLFLAKRKGRGYEIPLCYNVPKKEARETLRRLDRDRSVPLLGIEDAPKVFQTHTGRTLVGTLSKGDGRYLLCTQFAGQTTPTPRQFEFMLAGAEALERLIDEDEKSYATVGDDFIVHDSSGFITHPRGSFKDILTVEPDLIKLIRLAERASLSEAPILLEGETGVGKELFARAIHLNSRRKERPFVPINAGGVAVNLIESQLFGHVKGAYTDAVADRAGLVSEARGGTLFFDEAGEMGEELQVKLLRLLENGEYRRLGDNQTQSADVRIISATNRDLAKEVERGRFRKDLYYRLGAVKLTIPPLRFRQRDIQLLVRHFLIDCARRNRLKQHYFEIDAKAMEALELYDWPGNVRELYNEIMRIVSLIGGGDTIRFGMLSDPIKNYVKSKNKSDGLLERSMERIERRFILDALHRNDWNRLRTAEEIGIPRTTLLAKMKRLNIAVR